MSRLRLYSEQGSFGKPRQYNLYMICFANGTEGWRQYKWRMHGEKGGEYNIHEIWIFRKGLAVSCRCLLQG